MSRIIPVDRPAGDAGKSVFRLSWVFLLGFVLGETFLLALLTSLR
jgi:hypothetical protein